MPLVPIGERELSDSRFTGVFLNSFYAQDEGVSTVLDRLQEMGATAVATMPRVAIPAAPGEGKRFPDLHGDGHRRVLARPLWGKNELHLKSRLSYRPNTRLYAKTPTGLRPLRRTQMWMRTCREGF